MNISGQNKVFIAASLDGYIADASGKVDFLHEYPHAEGDDMGYNAFIEGVDAILMGRKTFETVLGFGIEWPYPKPVYVWSHSLHSVPAELQAKVKLVRGTIPEILDQIHNEGFKDLYIDGGQVIQSFLIEDLISEMIITTIPVVLGGGVPLFGALGSPVKFNILSVKKSDNGLMQTLYARPSKKI